MATALNEKKDPWVIFSCLLLICSVAHSGVSKKERFNLLSHQHNASFVEDSLKLLTSSSGLAVSTLIHYGVWYGICESAGLVSTLTGRSDLHHIKGNKLLGVKSSFCSQLAAITTSAEVALAGHISPWPLGQPWWYPLQFVRTGLILYNTCIKYDTCFIPIMAMTHFTHETVARTVAGASTVEMLKYHGGHSIQPQDYAYSEYTMLKSVAGLIIGLIVYEKLIARGYVLTEVTFLYLVSTSLTEAMLATGSFSVFNSAGSVTAEQEAGALALAGAAALSGSIAGATAGVMGVVSAQNELLALFATTFRIMVFSRPEVVSLYQVEDIILSGAMIGIVIGPVVIDLLLTQNSGLDSNHLLGNIATILIPAFSLALINGISNHVVYGYSLEESFTDTAHNQWQKFYAPLDYLYTLFD